MKIVPTILHKECDISYALHNEQLVLSGNSCSQPARIFMGNLQQYFLFSLLQTRFVILS